MALPKGSWQLAVQKQRYLTNVIKKYANYFYVFWFLTVSMWGHASRRGHQPTDGLSRVPLEVGEAKFDAFCSSFMRWLNSYFIKILIYTSIFEEKNGYITD